MRADDLAFAGAAEQARLVAAGEVSARELVEVHLDRIARHDPVLNAFRVVLADRARAEADAVDARRATGEPARPLEGVPIAVKDDMNLAGEVTARGSIAHDGRPAAADAKAVARLRAAGAVVLGKTNVPELMTMPFTETLWYGATRNPWDLDRTPGGSSGGRGAAVAAGLCAAATASDGAGSIRIPAACCGLVGLKPTAGRVPTPARAWRGLATFGVVSRTVGDAVTLYAVLTGEDWTPAPAGRLRVGWSVKAPPGTRGRTDATMRGAVAANEATAAELGHEVAEHDPDLGLMGANMVTRYLRGIADDAAAMAHPERLDRRTRGLKRLGGLIPEAVAARAEAAGAGADRDRLAAVFAHVDVLATPMFTELPPRIGAYEGLGAARSLDKALAYVPFPGLANHTGLPALAVPVEATAAGFPLAVQLLGPAGSEARLLGLAAQLEQAVGWPARRPAL